MYRQVDPSPSIPRSDPSARSLPQRPFLECPARARAEEMVGSTGAGQCQVRVGGTRTGQGWAWGRLSSLLFARWTTKQLHFLSDSSPTGIWGLVTFSVYESSLYAVILCKSSYNWCKFYDSCVACRMATEWSFALDINIRHGYYSAKHVHVGWPEVWIAFCHSC